MIYDFEDSHISNSGVRTAELGKGGAATSDRPNDAVFLNSEKPIISE